MPNPQQPELRRSGHDAVDDDAAATGLTAPSLPSVGGETGPVPEDNLPGHHPADEQDKPDPADFVAKAKEVAARKKAAKKATAGKKTSARKATAGKPVAQRASGRAAASKRAASRQMVSR